MLELTANQFSTLRSRFTPESPGSISLSKHVMNTGFGRAWADRWPAPHTLVIEVEGNYLLRGEPMTLQPADLQPHVRGIVDATAAFLPLLQMTFADLISWPQVIYTLERLAHCPAPAGYTVRRLTDKDAPALAMLTAENQWVSKTWRTPADLVTGGHAWGAFAEQRLVSVACIFFLGDEYEEIGIVTEAEFRGRGLAAACAAGLCADIQARGHIPSWTTATNNWASRRVAEKLGFHFDRNDTLYLIGMQSFAAAQHGGAGHAPLPLDTLYEQPLIELP